MPIQCMILSKVTLVKDIIMMAEDIMMKVTMQRHCVIGIQRAHILVNRVGAFAGVVAIANVSCVTYPSSRVVCARGAQFVMTTLGIVMGELIRVMHKLRLFHCLNA